MVNWGILGAGNIAHRFAKSLAQTENGRLIAISARKRERAEAFAEEFGVNKYYLDHNRLLEDPEIDAIYLCLPHHLHKEWAVKALQHKKAVLCEKPAVIHHEEMAEIAACARTEKVLFMEAMKTRFVPLYREIKDMVEAGTLGEIIGVEASICNAFSWEEVAATYLLDPASGGTLTDTGIYAACWLEDFMVGEPSLIAVKKEDWNGINAYDDAWVSFDNGKARLECALNIAKPRDAILIGTKGKLYIKEQHRPEKMQVCLEGKEPYWVEKPYEIDDFYSQIVAFQDSVEKGEIENSIMPLQASIRCAQILDSIAEG